MSVDPQKTGELYAQLFCTDCEELFDIRFTNTTAPPAEYAIAIEQKIGDGCPDCHGELVLVNPKQ